MICSTGMACGLSVWVAGCDHCCKECHNPVTWDPNGGLFFDEAKAEIFEELEKDISVGSHSVEATHCIRQMPMRS